MEDDSPLITPDTFLPSQWRDIHVSDNGGPNAHIKRLMRAVLEEALRDATDSRRQQHCSLQRKKKWEVSRSRRAKGRAADASAWTFDDDDGVFSFLGICEVLKIDPASLRARVRERLVEEQAA